MRKPKPVADQFIATPAGREYLAQHTARLDPAARVAQLEAVLRDLITWANAMGGWDAPVWRQAEALLEDR